MRNAYLIIVPLWVLMFPIYIQAQDAPVDAAEAPPKSWQTGAGLGMDFAQLFQLNPRQGAGQNRIGFGGAINVFVNYKKDRLAWDNLSSWQFGMQRFGSGVITQGATTKIPFQKANDELRLNSKIGYKTSEGSKLFYAANFSLLSQVVPTYNDTELPGNFPKALTDNSLLLSQFFSPAFITISAGMDYKPSDHFSVFYSPVGGKFNIVRNDLIAATGVHGNPVERDAAGNIISFNNVFSQLGSLVRLIYANKFLNDRLNYTSSMILFSNYLQNPQNVDLDWTNELALNILKGLQLSATVNVFYDDDILVQITDYNAPNGVSGLGKRVSLTQQVLLKYTVVF